MFSSIKSLANHLRKHHFTRINQSGRKRYSQGRKLSHDLALLQNRASYLVLQCSKYVELSGLSYPGSQVYHAAQYNAWHRSLYCITTWIVRDHICSVKANSRPSGQSKCSQIERYVIAQVVQYADSLNRNATRRPCTAKIENNDCAPRHRWMISAKMKTTCDLSSSKHWAKLFHESL